MPAHFGPTLPGVAGDAQRVARGPHAVVLRGECILLLEMVPELDALAVAAPPPNTDARVVPYATFAWPLLPCLVVDSAGLPVQSHACSGLASAAALQAERAACLWCDKRNRCSALMRCSMMRRMDADAAGDEIAAAEEVVI